MDLVAFLLVAVAFLSGGGGPDDDLSWRGPDEVDYLIAGAVAFGFIVLVWWVVIYDGDTD